MKFVFEMFDEVFECCTMFDGEMIVLNDELDVGRSYRLIYTDEILRLRGLCLLRLGNRRHN